MCPQSEVNHAQVPHHEDKKEGGAKTKSCLHHPQAYYLFKPHGQLLAQQTLNDGRDGPTIGQASQLFASQTHHAAHVFHC